MPKYLLQASYSAEGSKGLLKDGGTKRVAAARTLVESLGGKLDSLYFAFGDTDVVIIADLPNNTSAAGISIGVGASGAVRLSTTPLLTVEEMDEACKRQVGYTPPGA